MIIQPSPAERGQRPPSAIRKRFRAVADHLSAFEQLRNKRMLLESLQHMLRIKARILDNRGR